MPGTAYSNKESSPLIKASAHTVGSSENPCKVRAQFDWQNQCVLWGTMPWGLQRTELHRKGSAEPSWRRTPGSVEWSNGLADLCAGVVVAPKHSSGLGVRDTFLQPSPETLTATDPVSLREMRPRGPEVLSDLSTQSSPGLLVPLPCHTGLPLQSCWRALTSGQPQPVREEEQQPGRPDLQASRRKNQDSQD